jgi:hypothetical protein
MVADRQDRQHQAEMIRGMKIGSRAATTDYETIIGFYQILNRGNTNLTNVPLKPKSPTLSRTDMITFQ